METENESEINEKISEKISELEENELLKKINNFSEEEKNFYLKKYETLIKDEDERINYLNNNSFNIRYKDFQENCSRMIPYCNYFKKNEVKIISRLEILKDSLLVLENLKELDIQTDEVIQKVNLEIEKIKEQLEIKN